MEIKISTSVSKNAVKRIDCVSESRELVHFPFRGKGTSKGILLIETECSGRFSLYLKDIFIDDGVVIVIASANGKAFQTITNSELKNGDTHSCTVPLWGSSFTVRAISRDKCARYSFIIESIIHNERAALNFPNDFDNQGRIRAPQLKKFDYNTYQWTRAVGETSNDASGWVLGDSRYFVSCAHVVASGTVNKVHFLGDDQALNGIEIASNGEPVAIGTVPDPRNFIENNDDYGVIELDEFDMTYSRLSDLTGGIALNTEDESSLTGNTVFITGYPADTFATQLTSYYSVEDISVSSRASLRSTYEQQILVDAYASPGNSGSPIISSDKEAVVGILWGEVRATFVGDPSDPDYIYRGTKASHAWNGIKDKISGNFNSFTGLAAEYDVFSGKLTFESDADWQDVVNFSDNAAFKAFSGELSHLESYSLMKVKAKDKVDGSLVDVIIRLAQRTDEGLFSIDTSHGSQGSTKTLVVRCTMEDNPAVLSQDGVYHMWCGLESVTAGTDSPLNYVVYSFDVSKS